MAKGSTTWSFEIYRDLSRAVWEVAKLTPEQKEQIIEKLKTMGYKTTVEGMRQHFQKMIRGGKAASQEAANPNSSSDANQPNAKKKATATPRRGAGAGTKRKTKIPVDDDEDDEEQKTPKKRAKNRTISTKFEDDDVPSPPQDDKDSGESTAQLEKQQPMTFLDSSSATSTRGDDDANQLPSPEDFDSFEA
ncbi:hypothetical protein F4811DRAFT_491617 [Daldinia bambusicola]|nr:hypothetical protein F4811DRAFT_491617 [Daldinia bambusicola]